MKVRSEPATEPLTESDRCLLEVEPDRTELDPDRTDPERETPEAAPDRECPEADPDRGSEADPNWARPAGDSM